MSAGTSSVVRYGPFERRNPDGSVVEDSDFYTQYPPIYEFFLVTEDYSADLVGPIDPNGGQLNQGIRVIGYNDPEEVEEFILMNLRMPPGWRVFSTKEGRRVFPAYDMYGNLLLQNGNRV